jgi:Replication-relaxation
MENSGARLPRFRREREKIRSMELTLRDKEIIRQVARFRFLRSPQIVTLAAGSPAQILRRLQALYHHHYLDRPRCQIDYHHRGGSQPMAYGLGSRGVALMRREFDVPFDQMTWGRGGKDVGRVFLEHTLLIAETVTAIERAAKESGGQFTFISSGMLTTTSLKGKHREPFRWSATINQRRSGLIPDAVFALDLTAPNSRTQRVVIFLEADRGTMPVLRTRSPHLSNISRKLLAYADLWKSGVFTKRFQTQRFIVLTVTESSERAQNITDAVAKLTHGKGLFHTMTADSLAATPEQFLLHCEGQPRDKNRQI